MLLLLVSRDRRTIAHTSYTGPWREAPGGFAAAEEIVFTLDDWGAPDVIVCTWAGGPIVTSCPAGYDGPLGEGSTVTLPAGAGLLVTIPPNLDAGR